MPRSTLTLTNDVYAACCGSDLVLLDVARDQYYCLPQAADGVELDPASGALAGVNEDLVEDLRDAALIGDRLERRFRRWSVPPAREALALAPVARHASGLTHALLASLTMAWRFRGRSLAELVRRQTSERPLGADLEQAAACGARFQVSLPWLPVQGACLYQSFLLLEILRRRGLSADWVFGVRTWPFYAHCWVQAGDVVLNDTVDHVTSFEPIMVV